MAKSILKSKMLLLVVEDEESISQLMTDFLQAKGYKVVVAKNIEEARGKCKESKPDAVILDMLLPDGFGGELLGHFEKMEIPTVITSILSREKLNDLLHTKEYQFLQKPFDLSSLLDSVHALAQKNPGFMDKSLAVAMLLAALSRNLAPAL